MKKTTYITAILATALFSGAAFAEMDNVDDVLHGSGKVSASPRTPYVWVNSGPQGIGDDVIYGKKLYTVRKRSERLISVPTSASLKTVTTATI